MLLSESKVAVSGSRRYGLPDTQREYPLTLKRLRESLALLTASDETLNGFRFRESGRCYFANSKMETMGYLCSTKKEPS